MRHRQPCVYNLANAPPGTLYIGVTSDPAQRIWQHRNGMPKGYEAISDSHAGLVRTASWHALGDLARKKGDQGMEATMEDPADRMRESGMA